ncbi:MAG: GGDEF domain-containing protein [Deltaproteobacteria bacterium]|jgi:diguanylate cyclase|nr:GGDEF domain-containing protein [Deltaproteobacteria bacterium]
MPDQIVISPPLGETETSENLNEELVRDFKNLVDNTYYLAKKLLPFMARKRIPLTPYNYRLFFDYFEGTNEPLKEKLDEILRNKTLLTPNISEQLYHDFYDHDDERQKRLYTVGERIGKISDSLGENLGKTLDSAGHYRQVLSETAIQINQGDLEAEAMRELLDDLLLETKYALNNQSDLVGHIDNASKLIATLTSELRDQTRLANMDELTQLHNRRSFSVRLKQLVNLSKNPQKPIASLVLFDLDRFKLINDTHGHAIGDKVLILCAKIIKSRSEENDSLMACRYGGEEFLILCGGHTKDEAYGIAEEIRDKIQNTQIMVRGKNIPVTISGGVSQYREGDTIESFIERADQALYRAKSGGRNRVLIEEEA